jgi:hypothetical protein
VPQFSIHRGRLQGVLRDAVIERLGHNSLFYARATCSRHSHKRREGLRPVSR